MPEYDNTNSGVLFQNNQKTTEKSPDYTGKLDVNGHEYRLAGWKKKAKNGATFLSLKISEPQAKGGGQRAPAGGFDPDEAPF